MKSKLALLLATLLFFNIILPIKVSAASIQDQSKPIFGLTADQVVEKYNQLTDQQKDQVLRSLGNTSIFANSLFGNIFNSTFGALDDAVKKLGDLFFQANGVVYKLGSSALAWVSRLIDKVFNNDLNDVNISQPVVDDLYLNTRGLNYKVDPIFTQPNYPSIVPSSSWGYIFPFPTSYSSVYVMPSSFDVYNRVCVQVIPYNYRYNGVTHWYYGLFVDFDNHQIFQGVCGFTIDNFGNYVLSQKSLGYLSCTYRYFNSNGSPDIDWYISTSVGQSSRVFINSSFVGDAYFSVLKSILDSYYVYCPSYFTIENGFITEIPISNDEDILVLTNNTYYNYIYNIPDQTPLNINTIVSNTAINYDPVENLIQYLPDNYNIEQNFSVVNNYYISSGSSITGQAIDVNIVSPGVIDVRVINPEDLTQQVTNNVSKDIINNTDVNFGDLDFSPSITVGLNAAKDSIEGIVPVTGSSIVAQFVSGIPPDWLALGFVFLILFIAAGFGMSIIRH